MPSGVGGENSKALESREWAADKASAFKAALGSPELEKLSLNTISVL
jgi:hypothetical protein